VSKVANNLSMIFHFYQTLVSSVSIFMNMYKLQETYVTDGVFSNSYTHYHLVVPQKKNPLS